MKFLSFFLIVILSVLLQFQFRSALNWSPEFILAALIVIAFFAGLSELLFLAACSIWIVNWEPGLAPELAFLLLIPVLIHLVRRLPPWEPWLTLVVAVSLGTGAFIAATSSWSVYKTPLAYEVLGTTVVYGAFLFALFHLVLGYAWVEQKRIFT